jgi:hypothetical protein
MGNYQKKIVKIDNDYISIENKNVFIGNVVLDKIVISKKFTTFKESEIWIKIIRSKLNDDDNINDPVIQLIKSGEKEIEQQCSIKKEDKYI